MVIVDNRGLENAIKRLSNESAPILREYREHQYYLSKGERRRRDAKRRKNNLHS